MRPSIPLAFLILVPALAFLTGTGTAEVLGPPDCGPVTMTPDCAQPCPHPFKPLFMERCPLTPDEGCDPAAGEGTREQECLVSDLDGDAFPDDIREEEERMPGWFRRTRLDTSNRFEEATSPLPRFMVQVGLGETGYLRDVQPILRQETGWNAAPETEITGISDVKAVALHWSDGNGDKVEDTLGRDSDGDGTVDWVTIDVDKDEDADIFLFQVQRHYILGFDELDGVDPGVEILVSDEARLAANSRTSWANPDPNFSVLFAGTLNGGRVAWGGSLDNNPKDNEVIIEDPAMAKRTWATMELDQDMDFEVIRVGTSAPIKAQANLAFVFAPEKPNERFAQIIDDDLLPGQSVPLDVDADGDTDIEFYRPLGP